MTDETKPNPPNEEPILTLDGARVFLRLKEAGKLSDEEIVRFILREAEVVLAKEEEELAGIAEDFAFDPDKKRPIGF